MYRKIALILSVLFQPLVVPTMVFALVLYLIPDATHVPDEIKGSMLLMVVVTTWLIPMLSVFGLRYMSAIPSIHMAGKKDRFVPFVMVSVFYVMVTYFFYARLNYDELIVYSLIAITGTIILLTLVTFFWKISAHLTGLSGLLAITIVMSWKYPSSQLLYPMIFTVMLCGIVGSCRLYLNAHRPGELIAGFCLGFATCFISFYYFLL
ncbi:PA-phosphatase [Echinicola strongylocentroti]|uniref:PA-phosphatase n=1 Tax=Echinicola strongylocentroti TaxID=1795355 RepID=A0A2Z4IGP3_9BACT|nr:PA-phosphatase [Echinicola strongylocentroti]AWW29867.1 PA-phosphatase [Echinicola strongylocentroti]